jgi:hypothetical protein
LPKLFKQGLLHALYCFKQTWLACVIKQVYAYNSQTKIKTRERTIPENCSRKRNQFTIFWAAIVSPKVAKSNSQSQSKSLESVSDRINAVTNQLAARAGATNRIAQEVANNLARCGARRASPLVLLKNQTAINAQKFKPSNSFFKKTCPSLCVSSYLYAAVARRSFQAATNPTFMEHAIYDIIGLRAYLATMHHIMEATASSFKSACACNYANDDDDDDDDDDRNLIWLVYNCRIAYLPSSMYCDNNTNCTP